MEEFEIKSAEELAKMSASEVADYMLAKRDHDQAELQKLVDKKASKEDIEGLKAQIVAEHNERIEAVMTVLREQGSAIKRLGHQPKVEKPKTLREQLEDSRQSLTEVKQGKTRSLALKAVGDMTFTNSIVGGAQIPQALRLPGFNDLPQRRVRLLDIVQSAGIDGNIVEWVYMTNPEGSAAPTSETAPKAQIDFALGLGNERVEKTTARIRVTTEMLDDISFMENAIRNQLLRKLLQRVELGVYSGDGNSPNMHGIRTVATAFAAGDFANAISSPNYFDVLSVAMNQIAVAMQDSATPSAILMHPSDVTMLTLTKVGSTDGRYIFQPNGAVSFAGMPIVETTLVTQGEYLVGDFSLAYVLQKAAPSVQIGLDQDDFSTNHRTLLAEWRGVTYVMHNDRPAFVEGTFATDQTAIDLAGA